jgi:hypothetical protein
LQFTDEYDIIITSRGQGNEKMKRTEMSNLDTPNLEKIFEKLFKNLLTNTTKCGIIKTPKRKSKAKRSRKKLKNFRKTS